MHRAPLALLLTRAAGRGAAARAPAAPARAVTRAARAAAAHVAPPDPAAIAALFDQLQRGAASLVDVTVERDGAASLALHGPGGKSFLLTTEHGAGTVRLQSTASTGLAKSEMFYTYRHNAATGHWVCVDTGHFLIELLTRDCVFHFRGVPSW
jgi:hypothetical protein